MADAFSLANIEAHRADFLGPGVVQTLVQALETGFLVSQSVRFWTRVAPGEPPLIRLLVAFVSLVAFFQTGAAFYSWWRIYVRNFGDWIASIDPGWPERIQSIVTALMATPVQAFLIWRCWHILRRSYFVLIPLAAVLLGSLITSVIVTASIFNFDFTSSLEPGAPPPPKMPVSIPFILSLALPAFLDILVTGILLVFLLRSRATVYTRRFRRTLARLMLIAWESFLPPCACAVTAVITYGLLANRNFWDLAFQAILGKLYVISLFVTLNGRAELNVPHEHSHFPTLTAMAPHAIHVGMAVSAAPRLGTPIYADVESGASTDSSVRADSRGAGGAKA